MSGLPAREEPAAKQPEFEVSLQLDDFAREALLEECAMQNLAVEDLVSFALLYYLADVDSGRIARDVSASPRNAGPR